MISIEDQLRPQVRLRSNLTKQNSTGQQNQSIVMLDKFKQDTFDRDNRFKQFPAGMGRTRSGQQNSITLPKIESKEREPDALSQRLPNQTMISQNIQREMVQMEINQRVHDLEITIIDFKANIDRRITRTIEENPQKFMAVLKQLEEKETSMWKQNFDKHSSATDQLQMIKDGNRRQIEQLTTMILDLQKKFDDSEYKVSRIDKAAEGLLMKFNVIAGSQFSQQKAISNGDQQSQGGMSDFEVRLLRDAFNQEKLHKDTQYDDMQRQCQETNQRLIKQESEFYVRLKSQKDELMDQNQITKQQIKGLDNLKLQQINKDQDYIKVIIGSIDQKIAEEVDKRLRNEFENKNFLEQKFASFRDEVKNEEKQLLQGEQKFMKQVHESIGSLNQIMKNTREQLEAQMAASQTVVGENLKALSKTIDAVREGTQTKVQLIEQSQKDLNFRMSETRQMLHDHAQIVGETLQKEFVRLDKARDEFDTRLNKQIDSNTQQIIILEQTNEEWRHGFEKKNLQVFSEVSNALKTIKNEVIKEKKLNQERNDFLSKDLLNQKETFQGLIGNLEDHLTQIQKQNQFEIGESKKELKEMMTNIKIQLQIETDLAIKSTFEKSSIFCQMQIKITEDKLNERISKDSTTMKLYVDHQVDQSDQRMTEYVDDREKIMHTHINDQMKKEKYQREKLQELFTLQLKDQAEKQEQELIKTIDLLKQQLNTEIHDAIEKFKEQVKQQINDQHAIIKIEMSNIELKMSQRIDDVSEKIQIQIQKQNEYIQTLEKNLRSYVDQQVESAKFELKSLIKEVENEIFKLKVWVMKQIELMNQAMQELYTQIQSEMFMERMYMATTMELFQEQIQLNLYTLFDKIQKLRKHVDEKIKNLEDQIYKDLEMNIEQLRYEIGESLTDIKGQVEYKYHQKQAEQDIDREAQFQLKSRVDEITVVLDDLQTQMKDLEDQIYQDLEMNIEQIRYEIGESLTELKGQVDQSYAYFEAKLYMDGLLRQAEQDIDREAQILLKNRVDEITVVLDDLQTEIKDLEDQIYKDLEMNIKQLRYEVGESMTELKGQVDQAYIYFEGKLYVDRLLRQAEQDLEREQYFLLKDQVEKNIVDMQNLNNQLMNLGNQIYKDLEMNIEQLRYEIGESLTELKGQVDQTYGQFEAKLYMEVITIQAEQDLDRETQALLSNRIYQLVKEVQKIEGNLNITEKFLNDFRNAVEENFASIQENNESNIKVLNSLDAQQMSSELINKASFIDVHKTQQLTIDRMKKSEDILLDKLSYQQATVTGKILLIQVLLNTLETSIYVNQTQSKDQNLNLISETNKLMAQNLQTMEGNIQKVMESEIGKIYAYQEALSTQLSSSLNGQASTLSQLNDTQIKLKEDNSTLTNEIELNFGRVQQAHNDLEDKFQKSQTQQILQISNRINDLETLNQDKQGLMKNTQIQLDEDRKQTKSQMDNFQKENQINNDATKIQVDKLTKDIEKIQNELTDNKYGADKGLPKDNKVQP